MVDIYSNKIAFLKLKPKKLFFLVFLFGAFILLLLIIAYKFETYDHLKTKGYAECGDACSIITYVPTSIPIKKMKLNNKDWNPTIIHKEIKIDEENIISYYRLAFSTNESFMDKEIVDIDIYYNKQRMLKKIFEKIF